MKNCMGITSDVKKGYTSSVNAIVSVYGGSGKTMDLSDPNLMNEIASAIGPMDIISCADFGITAFAGLMENEDIASKNKNKEIEFVISTDKYYDVSLHPFVNGLTILAPVSALDKYRKQYPDLPITYIPVDIVACAIKDDMRNSAYDFILENVGLARSFASIKPKYFYFLGGRVQTGVDQWKENTIDIFRDEAVNVLLHAKGENCVISTHGLRTFTNGSAYNDFAAFDAFVDELKLGVVPEQNIFVFAQEDMGEKSRKPVLLIINKDGVKSIDVNGNAYYFALMMAIENQAKVKVTVEQMNFLPEFLNLGGDFSNMEPSYWDLSVDSNIETYEAVMEKYKNGETILDARAAWMNAMNNK